MKVTVDALLVEGNGVMDAEIRRKLQRWRKRPKLKYVSCLHYFRNILLLVVYLDRSLGKYRESFCEDGFHLLDLFS